MNVAIIPARGGSKRIPGKNIKEFCGLPIISYSIKAALESGIFDKVVVSTDDKNIAEISKELGAEVPFVRPDDISDDYATTVDVVCHSIEFMKENGLEVDYVCCIYATAPFINCKDIIEGYRLISTQKLDFVFPVTSFPFPIQRAIKIGVDDRVEMFDPDKMLVRSQDLEEAYHDAGQFYWGTEAAYLDKKPFFSNRSKAIIIQRYRVQDIDTQEDWVRAEAMFKVIGAA